MVSPRSGMNQLDTSAPPAKLAPKSMIAWWGLLSIIAYVAIETVFGWAEAKRRASAPEYAFSYFVGTILGGILISLFVSWIIFRVSRRSQIAATITFSLMLGLVCFNNFNQGQLSHISNTRLIQKPSELITISRGANETFALAHPDSPIVLTVPDGWEKAADIPAPILYAAVEPATGSTLGLIGTKIRDANFILNRKEAEAGLVKELGQQGRIVDRIDTSFLELPAYCVIVQWEVNGQVGSAARIMVEKPLDGMVYAVQFSRLGHERISPESVEGILSRFQMKKP